MFFKKSKFLSYREKGLKLHLRVDPDGFGVLVINSNRVVYLNQTAAFYIECMMRKLEEDDVYKLARRKFKNIDRDTVIKDYRDTIYKINSFISGEYCPIHSLGFERREPFSSKLTAPLRVDIALTYECNNKCIHCYSSSPRKMNSLPTGKWVDVLRKLRDIGVPQVLFTGGEPTLFKDLPYLIRVTEDLGLVSGVVSNGRRFKDREYVEKLIKSGLDFVQITLESHVREIHDRITRSPGSWDDTVNGVKNLVNENLYFTVNLTLSKWNYKDIGGTIDFLHSLGVKRVSANKLIYSGFGAKVAEKFDLTPSEMRETLEEIIDRTSEYDMDFIWYGVTRYCELNPLELGLGIKSCTACYITMAIEPNGNVIPCQSYYKPIGNILKDNWKKIWYHPLCIELRERRFMPQQCRECIFYNTCTGCPLEIPFKKYPEMALKEV